MSTATDSGKGDIFRITLNLTLAAVLAVICSKNPIFPAAVFSASLIGMIFLRIFKLINWPKAIIASAMKIPKNR